MWTVVRGGCAKREQPLLRAKVVQGNLSRVGGIVIQGVLEVIFVDTLRKGGRVSPLVMQRKVFALSVHMAVSSHISPPATYRPPSINSRCPDIGGALRLGGAALVSECSFLSNSAASRGLAIAVVASATISGLSFERNELFCGAGLYHQDNDEVRQNDPQSSTTTRLFAKHSASLGALLAFSCD